MVNLPTIDMTGTGQNINRLRKQAEMPAVRSPGLKVRTPAFQAGGIGFKSHGDYVEEGTWLCDIEDESARLGLESAEKNYKAALAGYEGSDLSLVKEQVRIAQSNYEGSR